MVIRSVTHKGLGRLLTTDEPKGIRSDLVPRVRNVLAALVAAADMDGVRGPPGWRVHQLVGDRAGTWSIAVSGNWRITFVIVANEITNSIWRITIDDGRPRQDRDAPPPSRRVRAR